MAIFFVAAAATPADAGVNIVKTADLAFGSLIAGSGGTGTVTIAPSNGQRTATGGVTLMNSTYQAASFTVSCTGLPCLLTLYYNIDSVSDITLTSGGNSMSVGSFKPYSVNNSGSSTQGVLIPLLAPTDTLKVGATLTVGNNQAPGNYSGNFSVTVTYP